MQLPTLRAITLTAMLLVPAVGSGADPAVVERGRSLVAASCFLCHGMRGETTSELYPRLAAQNAHYVAKQLRDFRERRRTGGGMEGFAARLTDADIAAIALYFSVQKLDPLPAADRATVERGGLLYQKGKPGAGLKSCASCHGADAHGEDLLPRLAGQQPAYIVEQLRNFRRPWRRAGAEAMHDVSGRLTDAEVSDLAAFLAQLP